MYDPGIFTIRDVLDLHPLSQTVWYRQVTLDNLTYARRVDMCAEYVLVRRHADGGVFGVGARGEVDDRRYGLCQRYFEVYGKKRYKSWLWTELGINEHGSIGFGRGVV